MAWDGRLPAYLAPLCDARYPAMRCYAMLYAMLQVQDCDLRSAGAAALAAQLPEARALTHLDLSTNRIDDEACPY